MLEKQPAARQQMPRCACNDRADGVEAVGAAVGECLRRLEAQVAARKVRVARRDVGRIRDDQVEAPPADRLVP